MLQRQMQIVVRAELLLQEFGDLAALGALRPGMVNCGITTPLAAPDISGRGYAP
jgi:hypothetical protein